MKNKLIIKISVILMLSLIIISCLEVETTINVSNDFSGTWTLTYRIMQEASYLTPGDELMGYNYFPLSKNELLNRLDGISGLELISYSVNETIMYTEFHVEVSFNNTNDIALFFNTYSNNSLVDISLTEEGVFQLIIYNPFPETEGTDTLDLAYGLYSDKNISITVVLPGVVTDSNQGPLSDNPSEAGFIIKTMETFNITEPLKWIVKYE